MTAPRVQILGAYKIKLTNQLFQKALTQKYSGPYSKHLEHLTEKQRHFAEERVKEELSSVVLLEVLVKGADKRFSMGDFRQPDTDQVAYDEAFLSMDGTLVLSRLAPPENDDLRVAFFLHFFDPQKPLLTSYGEVPVPPLQEMSPHLKRLIPYEPVD